MSRAPLNSLVSHSSSQMIDQPDDRFHVKMVGRLVKQENIRIEGQDLGQFDAHFPAAAE
jgi:hypothetical protein